MYGEEKRKKGNQYNKSVDIFPIIVFIVINLSHLLCYLTDIGPRFFFFPLRMNWILFFFPHKTVIMDSKGEKKERKKIDIINQILKIYKKKLP